MEKQQINVIVGLRGMAAVMVMLFHFVVTTIDFIDQPQVIAVFGKFNLGVQLFFVISGIVIPFSLIKAQYNYSKLGTFLLKRAARIEPPYLLAVALAFAYIYLRKWLPGAVPSDHAPGIWDLLLHLGYLVPFVQGAQWLNEVFWTLAVEFQYYLLIALAMPWILKPQWYFRYTFYVVFACSCLLPLGTQQLLHWSPLFLCGILFTLRYFEKITPKEYFVATGLCLGFIVYHMGIWNFLAASVALVTVWLIPTFESRVSNFFGSISYSLYLLHTLTGGAVVNILSHHVTAGWQKFLVVLIGIAIATIASYLYYRMVESPAQRWSQRIKYH